MEKVVVLYLYVDYLLDARFPKNFSKNSDHQMILETLNMYFDEALDKKGFDFQKFERNSLVEVTERRPLRFDEMKRSLVSTVESRLRNAKVFSLVSHPLFGRKCEVDADKFIKILEDIRHSLAVSDDGSSLKADIDQWGVDRFKNGLSQVYRSLGDNFNPDHWTDFADGTGQSHGDEIDLPRLDAIVPVDHDMPEVIEIRRLGTQLIDQLQSTNDLGNLTRDEANAAAGEVRQLMTAFEASRLRKKFIFDKAQASLSWIISKSSDAFFGVVATALLAAIAAYFGYNL